MKKIIAVIGLMLVCLSSDAQVGNQLNEMIISSINSYIDRNEGFVKRGNSFRDTCHHYICKDGLPAEFPYDSINNAIFFSLSNLEGLPNSFKGKLKKGLNACFVRIRLTDTQMIVSVSGRVLKLIKRNRIGINVGDWGVFTYEYSCDKQEWKLKEIKFGGV